MGVGQAATGKGMRGRKVLGKVYMAARKRGVGAITIFMGHFP